ncbi:hypothetical protein V6N13_118982 [Hibiscus sabdariffa]
MVNSMVEGATSDLLVGPDWARNIEICDMLTNEPGQAKDVVKGIKKKLGSKNSKVQLLALTPDFYVKEKILTMIDTWQEAFGGTRARYPQYFVAYQELLRAGAVFPPRSERSAPVFTPPQTQPLSSYPQNIGNYDQQEISETSEEPDFPTLSLTEIQKARGIMDVLAEMLNALAPGKEGLRQDVIVDLVDQCRTYKLRIVHLVNSTSDESLLGQGLALNDDLQRVLAKHEELASGTSSPTDKPKPEPARKLVNVDGPLLDTGNSSKQFDGRSTSNTGVSSGLTLPAAVSPKMDLLSSDNDNSPKAETLALVPLGEPQQTTPVSQQNALVLIDMFSDGNTTSDSARIQSSGLAAGQTNPSTPQIKQQQQQQNFRANGTVLNIESSGYEQSHTQVTDPTWNGQMVQQHQNFNVNGVVPNMGSPRYEQLNAQSIGPAWNSQMVQQQQNFHANGAVPNMGSPRYEKSNAQDTGSAWNGQMIQHQHTFNANGIVSNMGSPSYEQTYAQATSPAWNDQLVQQQSQNFHSNGTVSNMGSPRYEQSYAQGTSPVWSGQLVPHQQLPSPVYGAHTSGSLPPPPWEAQAADSSPVAGSQYPQSVVTQVVVTHTLPLGPQHMGSDQVMGVYIQPIMNGNFPVINNQAAPRNQFSGIHPQPNPGAQYMGINPQQMPTNQMASMYPQQMMYGNQMGAYDYGELQYLDQKIEELSIRDDSSLRNSSYQLPTSSYAPPGKPSKGEDMLFGDLVDMTNIKAINTVPRRAW